MGKPTKATHTIESISAISDRISRCHAQLENTIKSMKVLNCDSLEVKTQDQLSRGLDYLDRWVFQVTNALNKWQTDRYLTTNVSPEGKHTEEKQGKTKEKRTP